MIKINDKQLREFEAELKTFGERAYPFAVKNTLNDAAKKAQQNAKKNLSKNMTLRNQWTRGSVMVKGVRGLNVNTQEAAVGTERDYLEDQEFGGTKAARGSVGTPIATSFSAGQGRSKNRTKVATRGNRLAFIQLKKRKSRGTSKRQANLIAIRQAKTGDKIYLDLGRTKGIFRREGGKKNPRIQMVQDLSRKSVRIPRNPWLFPAVERTKPLIPAIYKGRIVQQLKRHNLFRG